MDDGLLMTFKYIFNLNCLFEFLVEERLYNEQVAGNNYFSNFEAGPTDKMTHGLTNMQK